MNDECPPSCLSSNFTGTYKIDATVNYSPMAVCSYDLNLNRIGQIVNGSADFKKQTIWHCDYLGTIQGNFTVPDSLDLEFLITWTPGHSQSRVNIKFSKDMESFEGTHISLMDGSSGSYKGYRKNQY